MHRRVRIGSTRDQRDPLQLVEHSGDAAGIMPAIANVDPTGPRDAAPSLISAYCNVCGCSAHDDDFSRHEGGKSGGHRNSNASMDVRSYEAGQDQKFKNRNLRVTTNLAETVGNRKESPGKEVEVVGHLMKREEHRVGRWR